MYMSFSCCCFWERVFKYSPWCPRTCYVAHGILKLMIYLPLLPKDCIHVPYHAWLWIYIFFSGKRTFEMTSEKIELLKGTIVRQLFVLAVIQACTNLINTQNLPMSPVVYSLCVTWVCELNHRRNQVSSLQLEQGMCVIRKQGTWVPQVNYEHVSFIFSLGESW